MKFGIPYKALVCLSFLAFVQPTFAVDPALKQTTKEVAADIRSQIAADKSLSDTNINVTSDNAGNVIVKGNVKTDSQASRVIEIAEGTTGVKSTDVSLLTVKDSQHPVSDAVTTAKVKGSFVREKLFGDKAVSPMSISVETQNGVVYLTGTANSQTEINNAIKIAKSVSGVKSVESKVEVKP